MNRLRLSDIRTSRIPRVLQLCSDDDLVATYANEAQQRLMQKGDWWGTYQRYAICVTDGCITWPRHFAKIGAVAICDYPVRIRNHWFEFLEMGNGLQTGSCGSLELIDRGTTCLHEDVIGYDKKIKVTADQAEDAGQQALLKGLNDDMNPIRNNDSGTWIDGEYVDIDNATPAISTNIFSTPGPLEVQLPTGLNGRVRLYEYDPSDASERLIATYDPDETVPMFRRSLVGGLDECDSCCADSDCGELAVTVMAKLDHIRVIEETDTFIIQNLEALTHMVQAMRYEEMDSRSALTKAESFEAKAIRALEKELEHYTPQSQVVPVRIDGIGWGAGNIEKVY